MKFIHWVRFTWDLTQMSGPGSVLPAHYQIAPASRADEKELRKVIATSFLLDPVWNPTIHEVMETVNAWVDRSFESETSVFLALRHGLRIIGASILSLDPASEAQLAPGPCLMMEYRNRGFGTHLLAHSFVALREAGLTRVATLAKSNAPVARFLYPKFSGTCAPAEPITLLAA